MNNELQEHTNSIDQGIDFIYEMQNGVEDQ